MNVDMHEARSRLINHIRSLTTEQFLAEVAAASPDNVPPLHPEFDEKQEPYPFGQASAGIRQHINALLGSLATYPTEIAADASLGASLAALHQALQALLNPMPAPGPGIDLEAKPVKRQGKPKDAQAHKPRRKRTTTVQG